MYKVIAHRANIDGLQENSLAAIQKCLELKVDGIEIDIRHSYDGTPYLFHDVDVHRLADVDTRLSDKKKKVVFSTLTSQEIDDFLKLKNNDPVPKMSDAVSLLQSSDSMSFIELKDTVNEKTLKIIQYGFSNSPERLRIISFNHSLLHKIKKHNEFFKTVKMLALHEVPKTTWLPSPVRGLDGVNSNLYNPLYSAYLKARSHEVGLWWLGDKVPPIITQSLFFYIDFLTTDRYRDYKK